nr:hypothetical protein [Tanacetum cinerariifolium]
MKESMNKFMAESAKRHDENIILIKEINSLNDAAIQNQGASIKALEIQIRQMSLGNLAPTKLTVELADRTIKYPKGVAKNVVVRIVKNMDSYRDQGMGDVIFGEPFCKASCVEATRFDELITIHNGNDNVTYRLARSHPRFKHLSNAKCNKIRPLLKVSVRDKLNGISHPYQKLKSFYKEVLNLGPEYIRDAKTEEWLTHGTISVHEME